MRELIYAVAVFVAAGPTPATAQTSPPAGVATGQVLYFPPDATRGEGLDVAVDPGAAGSFTLSGGDVLTLRASPSLDGPDGQPVATAGQRSGADGRFLVTGTGTQFQLLGDDTGATFTLGRGGIGSLTVADGALLRLFDDQNTTLSSASVQLGAQGGDGTFVVDDAAVEIASTSDAFIFVGANRLGFPPPSGRGTVEIRNGSNVVIRDFDNGLPKRDFPSAGIVIGQEDGGSGRVTIDDSTVLIEGVSASAGVEVAREEATSGVFEVRGGASLTLAANTSGAATPDDRFAFVTVGTEDGSSGQLVVDEGSVVTMSGPNAFVGIGRGEGSVGRLTVQGGGELVYAGPDGFVEIGQDDPAALNGGAGFLTVDGGGSLFSVTGDVEVGKQSGAGSSTGVLTVGNGGVFEATSIDINEGGILTGASGTVIGDVDLLGGLIAPGASPGLLTIDGDLTLSGGALGIEIAGSEPGMFDVLSVLGDVMVDGPFELDLAFLDGFEPGAGDVFPFLDAGGVIGDFTGLANVSVSGLEGGFGAGLVASADGSFAVEVAPIPLPAAIWLLGAALGGLAAAGARRRV